MFSFLRKSAVRAPSPEIVRALAATAGSAGRTDFATAFKVVEMGGKYSGRKVTHIRVFDPATIAARGVDVRAYGDLDSHPDLILWAGRVEQDGTVMLNQVASTATASTMRQAADRSEHGDVERFIGRPGE